MPPTETETSEQSERSQRLHEASVKLFPDVSLSEQEYVIYEVKRHAIGIIGAVILAVMLGLLVILGLGLYPLIVPSGNPPFSSLLLPAALLLALIGFVTYIVAWVYQKNRMFITNESVIQQVQLSLFSYHEKTVGLAEVKDISYSQSGVLELMFDYGSIVMTIEGDDETYRFSRVTSPKNVAHILTSIVEDFKSGRQISERPITDLSSANGSS